ncbi:MAG: hypothetical protein AB7W28_10890 [Armatimonadota bacterium]
MRFATARLSATAKASVAFAAAILAGSPAVSQAPAGRVFTAVAEPSLSYHVAKPEEVELAIRDLAPYFDIVWVRIPPWTKDILNHRPEIERAQQIIDAAHAAGMRVAFCFSWAGLLPRQSSIEAQGDGEQLFGKTLDPTTGALTTVEAWDYGSQAALDEFRTRCRRLFALVDRPAEMFVVDEEILATPGQNFWYCSISTYWTSPTFSRASLEGFRRFLAERGAANAAEARFPVTTEAVEPSGKANEGLPAVPFTESNRDLLVADNGWPDSDLWVAWYQWRNELYARWLDTVCEEAKSRWADAPEWLGTCYVMPDSWAVKGLGQDLGLIAMQPNVDIVCAGYNSGLHFDWFKHAAAEAGKKWGSVVQLCTYGKAEGTAPDVIRQTVRTAVEAGASVLHVYSGDNFRTGLRDRRDSGLYYMPEQVEAWKQSVEWLRTLAP